MIRTLTRAWRYFTALLDGKLDDLLDPRVQIDQAIDEARRRHALLSEQVTTVRANERELEVRIARKREEAEDLRASVERALLLSERHRAAGQADRSEAYERTARALAAQLTAVESSHADLLSLLDSARAATSVAMRALEQNSLALQQQVNERARLVTELEAAKLQERMADALRQLAPSAVAGDVPTLDDVRERIDRRFAHATARGEIAAGSIDARMLDVRKAAIDVESDRRLEEIRAGLGLAAPAEGGQGG
ncbi:MAG TPA: PspA/IM30 family protein [Candidatus Limnocylindria bacterium]|nr:PspA/IM30 family protein [Candidatus Limnocylindria bacterium]